MRRKSSVVQTPATQFVFYSMQRGPITTNAALLELIGRCGEQSATAQDLKLFADIWSDTSGQALGKPEFLQLLGAIKDLRQSGRHYIGQEAATELFFGLSSGGDVLPTLCLRRVLSLIGFRKLDCNVDFFSQATFWSLVNGDGVLAQLLLEKLPLLSDAAAIANAEGFHPNAPRMKGEDDEDLAVDPAATTAEQIADEIGRVRQEIAVATERSRVAALLRQQSSQKQQKISYFAPQLVTEMFADVDAEFPLLQVLEAEPGRALDELDQTLTSQVLVARVGDLRKHRAARDERQENRQRRCIQHAAYEATQLRSDNAVQLSSSTSSSAGGGGACLKDLSFLEGIGEKSSKRLYPYHRSPMDNIRAELALRLGVELAKPAEPSDKTETLFSTGRSGDEERKPSSLRPGTAQSRRPSSASQPPEPKGRGSSAARRTDEVKACERGHETAARNEIKGFFFSNAPRVITPNYSGVMPKYVPPEPTALDRIKQRLAEPSVAVVRRIKKQEQLSVSAMSGLSSKADIFHRSQILLCDARDALNQLYK